MFKMAFQVVFSAKNVPRFSFVLLAAPKPKKQGGAIMAPPRVTTSFQSMGKIGLNSFLRNTTIFPQMVSLETSFLWVLKIGKLFKEIHYFVFQTAKLTN